MSLKLMPLVICVIIIGYCLVGCSGGRAVKHRTVSSPGLAKSPWPKILGNMQNTGRGIGSGAKGTIKWRIDCCIHGSPVIGPDNIIYGVSQNGNLCAIDSTTGSEKWKISVKRHPLKKRVIQSIPGHEDITAFLSSPVIGSNGVLYVGSLDKHLYAIDAKTGSVIWVSPIGDEVNSPATIGPGGLVIVTTVNGMISAFDGVSGSKRWQFKSGSSEPPAIGANGLIYLSGSDGFSSYVHALDCTGKHRWKLRLDNASVGNLVIGSDGMVSVCCGSAVYAIDGAKGTKVWAYAATPGHLINSDRTSSLAIGPDGSLYIFEGNDKLSAVDSKTAKRKWTLDDTIDYVFGTPCLAVDKCGIVYSPCLVKGVPGLQAVNGATGRRMWIVEMNGPSGTPAIGSDGTVYVSTGGYLYAVN